VSTKIILSFFAIACILFLCNCKDIPAQKQAEVKTEVNEKAFKANNKKIDELNADYSLIPDDKILENGDKDSLYYELKERYRSDAARLKQMVDASGAKLLFIGLAPEVGNNQLNVKYGMPYIRSVCQQLGIEFIDLAPSIAPNLKEITQWPNDGHWSKKGAVFIAGQLAPLIKKYSAVSSTVVYKDGERTETFGDLAPNTDEVVETEKNITYHVKANAQGVRMDKNIEYPKTTKHVLFMGDEGIFCPLLDNEFTITGILQQQFPGMLMLNTGAVGHTLEDQVSLWSEKAKYSQPDIVIIQTNGSDITDYYFTQRNHYSRSHKPFYPTASEEKFYKTHYHNN